MGPEFEAAVRGGNVEVLRGQLAAREDVDQKDKHGQTGLMIAAMRGQRAVVELLIERGAALDHTAKFRLSALMLAVIKGHEEIARALAAAGADRSLTGSGAPGFAGKTASDLAAARGLLALAAELAPPGAD